MKKVIIHPPIFLVVILFWPALLWAKSSASPGSGFSNEVLWQSISFFLLLILLVKFFKKPIKASLARRREEIKTAFDQLIQKEKEAEAQITAWERKLNSLSQEIAELHQKIIAEGEAERERIIAHAQEQGEHIKKQAQIVAEQELKKALAVLKKETVDLAIVLAQDMIKGAMQPKDQMRLVKEFIGQIGANP